MKARHLATAAVIGLGLTGAAWAQTDNTRTPNTAPGAGTPPAASDQASPSTSPSSPASPGMGSSSSGMTGSSSTMTTAPDATGGGSAMAGVDAKGLVGTDIKNAQNEKVGEVQAVQLDSAGKVRNLIVGVGGFLGLGERAVALQPSAVTVADNGDTIRTTLTKDQLKAMPEYQYSDKSYKGEIFNDSGVVKK
jgi:sporulation protein YlmC with PRC-barrel domain